MTETTFVIRGANRPSDREGWFLDIKGQWLESYDLAHHFASWDDAQAKINKNQYRNCTIVPITQWVCEDHQGQTELNPPEEHPKTVVSTYLSKLGWSDQNTAEHTNAFFNEITRAFNLWYDSIYPYGASSLPREPKTSPDAQNLPFQPIEPKKGCQVCGGTLAEIRGKFPSANNRIVCPTCLRETLDRFHEQSAEGYGKTYSQTKPATGFNTEKFE